MMASSSCEIASHTRSRSPSNSPRRSRLNRDSPGTMFTAPGNASSWPTVPMMWCSDRQMRSTASAASDAPEQGVAAHVVRRPARVAGLALDEQLEPARARDGRHDRERLAAAVELGPLLDVRLEVPHELGGAPGGLADAAGVESEVQEGLADRRALGIRQRPPVVVPRAGDGRRAEQRLAEPRALFVREGDDLERERERRPPAAVLGRDPQQAHDLEPHQHADDPVVAARVGHGVQVRPDEEGRGVRGTRHGEPAELVAGGILPRRHADLAHPLRREAVDPRVLGREVDALDPVVGRRYAGELVAARHHPPGRRGDLVGRGVEAGCSRRVHPGSPPRRRRLPAPRRRSARARPRAPRGS